MAIPKLKVDFREGKGRRSAKQLRKKGFIPGVVYGHNKETKSIKFRNIDIERILSRYGHSGTFNIELDGEQIPVIIKEIQRHITKDGLLHVDLQQLSAGEKIKLSVPIHLEGKEKVETSATILQQQLNELDIQCLPKNIPNSIKVDVSKLGIGKSLDVKDLEVLKDENIEVLNDSSEVVASLTTASREEESDGENDIPIYESSRSILG